LELENSAKIALPPKARTTVEVAATAWEVLATSISVTVPAALIVRLPSKTWQLVVSQMS
jgi:hypothetical protein